MRILKRYGAWLLCAAALAMVGCANPGNAMRQAVASAAVTVAAGYRTLGIVDKTQQDKVRSLAKSDPRQADAMLTTHLQRYDVARKALDAAAALVVTANAAVPLVDKGTAGERSVAAWVADLVAVALAVTKALAALGVI